MRHNRVNTINNYQVLIHQIEIKVCKWVAYFLNSNKLLLQFESIS